MQMVPCHQPADEFGRLSSVRTLQTCFSCVKHEKRFEVRDSAIAFMGRAIETNRGVKGFNYLNQIKEIKLDSTDIESR